MRNKRSCFLPGGNQKKLICIFIIYLFLLALITFFLYAFLLSEEKGSISYEQGGRLIFFDGEMLCDINELLEGIFEVFWSYLILCAALAAGSYYSVYREKSIYVFKRMENPFTLHRMCLGIPALLLALGVLVMLILLAVFYEMYVSGVPAECLPEFQGIDIWRLL